MSDFGPRAGRKSDSLLVTANTGKRTAREASFWATSHEIRIGGGGISHRPDTQPDPSLAREPGTPRVLIADPDQCLVTDYTLGLLQRGFAAAAARDGLECLKLLRSFRPDVLVLEPALPWGGGDGIVTVMNEDPEIVPVPVIVLTHGCDRRTLYNLAPFPIEDYRRKPMTCTALADCIQSIICRTGGQHNRRTPGGFPCTMLEIHK